MMENSLDLSPLVAQLPDAFEAIGRQLQRPFSPGALARLVLVLSGLVLGCWALSRWYQKMESSWRYFSQPALWRELCRAHDLTQTQARHLLDLAQDAHLEPLEAIFLSPTVLDEALSSENDAIRRETVAELRQRLFHSS